jgi:hypothetical protein
VYNADEDGGVFSEKEIMQVLSSHYTFYKNMPWFLRLYYKPWTNLLDSLVLFLAPTYVAHANASTSILDEVDDILEESSNEDSNP